MTDQSAINETRALLRAFVKSEIKTCHVVVDGLEIYLSRDASNGADRFDTGQAAPPAAQQMLTELLAPHIGTIASLSAPGTMVMAGEAYGRIRVLDEEINLISDADGVVTAHCRALGELVEYGHAIITVAA